MDNLSKKIKEALTKSMKDEFIFEGIDNYKSKSLDEFFSDNDKEDYIWEEDLEEALYDEEDEMVGDRAKQFNVGDILLTTSYNSKGSYRAGDPHKVMVVTSKKEDNGIIHYEGFLLSSKTQKSNKNSKYANNIHIDDYDSILYRGKKTGKKNVFIRVDDLVRFTNMDHDISGTWKGTASYQFMNFVQKCVNNYLNGRDNSNMYWRSKK